jgi:hypothetical protein
MKWIADRANQRADSEPGGRYTITWQRMIDGRLYYNAWFNFSTLGTRKNIAAGFDVGACVYACEEHARKQPDC